MIDWRQAENDYCAKMRCYIQGPPKQEIDVTWNKTNNAAWVHHYVAGSLVFQEKYTALSMEAAKAEAIKMIKDYLDDHLNYWRRLRGPFDDNGVCSEICLGVRQAIAYENGELDAKETVLSTDR